MYTVVELIETGFGPKSTQPVFVLVGTSEITFIWLHTLQGFQQGAVWYVFTYKVNCHISQYERS